MKILIALIALVCVIAVLFALYRVKSKSNNIELVDNSNKLYNVRVDIYNQGEKSNTIEIKKQIPTDVLTDKFDNCDWMPEPGIGTSLSLESFDEWKDGKIVFKTIGAGSIRIDLMGAHRFVDGTDKLQKIYVEFKDVELDGKVLFEEAKKVWHEDRFTYVIPSENDVEHTLKFKYRNPQ